MKPMKRHKVKTEKPESSTSHNWEQEVHDLAYYIHDRVELMHQVFSVLKYKELKAMAPACIRNISIDDLQELCTEELLGISSKRLCAILDGAEPPSDTESSSPSPPPEQMETISLDSISSDEEILSQTSSKKKKHKHRRHESKSKSKRKKSKDDDDEEADRSKASRAGLTVLELLELQARARAIRAQLQQEHVNKPSASETTAAEPANSSDNEVEIKEEPAEVVEISSEDEKPKVEELEKRISQGKQPDPPQVTTVTKRINDLVITVPQKSKQKIKLNRNKNYPTPSTEKSDSVVSTQNTETTAGNAKNAGKEVVENSSESSKDKNRKDKTRKKKKHKKRLSKDDDDNDEITLQLSDTEKMDLLEDLDRKTYDCVSSDTSSDSSSDSDHSVNKPTKNRDAVPKKDEITPEQNKESQEQVTINAEKENTIATGVETSRSEEGPGIEILVSNKDTNESYTKDSSNPSETMIEEKMDTESNENKQMLEIEKEIISLIKETNISNEKDTNMTVQDTLPTVKDNLKEVEQDNDCKGKESEKNLSEGELSDRESSEVEAVDFKPEVVCISDEENGNKSKKKKKKKDKKAKKDKKSKKKSDFREGGDQNFYKEHRIELDKEKSVEIDNSTQFDSSVKEIALSKNRLPSIEITQKEKITTINIDDTEKSTFNTAKLDSVSNVNQEKEVKSFSNSYSDTDNEEVFEILELSDDSSCCEVEYNILSKEPTTSEIEALSAKIDEIDRVEVITEGEIREYEKKEEDKMENIENISWKDRYLDSKKVKTVLTTANVLNALRKKNRELKKKLAQSKKVNSEQTDKEEKQEETKVLEEGTIEHYNTLEGSTKYVDPVKEVSRDLKKDAKILLKMYKKLLKFNDVNKPVDPDKKKKKKKKKKDKKGIRDKDHDITEDIDPVVEVDTSVNREVNLEQNDDLKNKGNDLESSNVDDNTVNKGV